jgi:uncharacterized oligopeptide transporter (OPT) family protein
VISIAVVGVIVYYSLRIDWARIIGRWFPWAVDDADDEKGADYDHGKKGNA